MHDKTCCMKTIRQIVLARRPKGTPVPQDFALTEAPMPAPGPGEMLVRMRVGSVDPAIRGFLDDRPSYVPPVAIGAPIAGMSLGEVVESHNPDWPVHTLVRAFATWSDHYVLSGDAWGLERVTPQPGVALEHYMGTLGPVGLTAWVGLFEIGKAGPGDTVLVSAAAGATGSTVVQIAKARGATVIGIAGGAEKAKIVRELGADFAIDYRAETDLAAAIRSAAPDGIDVYFDNVGGEMLDAILPLMRLHGRIALCGMVAQYNDADHPHGMRNLWQLVVNRVSMRGFITFDHPEVLAQAQAELDGWAVDGRLKPLANIRDGFRDAARGFHCADVGADGRQDAGPDMIGRLNDKRCFVTGGASGLGAAISRRFVAEGASVVIADIDAAAGTALADELGAGARFVTLDVSDEEHWIAALATCDALDVLVNNAGITTLGSIEEVTLAQLRHEFEIDVVGVFLGCKYIIPKMRPHGGSVINMSSMTGVRAQGNLVAYNAAKAAVTHMTKSCALHYAERGYGIRCNSIHPGAIHTSIIDKVLAQSADPEALLASFVAVHPMGRLGQPEDIAAIAVYLASDESGFATGAEFRIDGGSTL